MANPPPLPPEEVGPHFEVSETGIVGLAPPKSLDRDGNNVQRLRALHPMLSDLSNDLVQGLSVGNVPHARLRSRAAAYRRAIDQPLEIIDFSLLYVEGVRLANAEAAAVTEVRRGDLPPLDESAREQLDTLLRLHGTFMLSTIEGIEAIAAEERYQRRPEEERQYREAAMDFAISLQGNQAIIDPTAAAVVVGAAEQIGHGSNLERSGVIGTGTVQNVAIALTGVATVATLSLASGLALGAGGAALVALITAEPLKKSKPFIRFTSIITEKIDAVAETELGDLARQLAQQRLFVSSVEPKLRALARTNKHFSWLNATLDWLSLPEREDIVHRDERNC